MNKQLSVPDLPPIEPQACGCCGAGHAMLSAVFPSWRRVCPESNDSDGTHMTIAICDADGNQVAYDAILDLWVCQHCSCTVMTCRNKEGSVGNEVRCDVCKEPIAEGHVIHREGDEGEITASFCSERCALQFIGTQIVDESIIGAPNEGDS
jgi:hypothetical protein